jgi:hypothetical protein
MAVSSSLCVRMLTAGCDRSDSDWLDKNGSVNSSRLLPVVCICTCFIDDLCANRSAFYPTRPHFMITSPRLTHVRITSCSRHVHVSSRSCSRQLTLMFTSAHAHVHVSSRSSSRQLTLTFTSSGGPCSLRGTASASPECDGSACTALAAAQENTPTCTSLQAGAGRSCLLRQCRPEHRQTTFQEWILGSSTAPRTPRRTPAA